MSLKWFICTDNVMIERDECIKKGGCRMGERCATLPYLLKIGDRKDIGKISPSKAGNGARMEFLKVITDYAVSPDSFVFASMGIGLHEKLSIHKYTGNVLSEEKLSDGKMSGIPDVLEEDESSPGCYVLYDYKTWGSYKLAKALGIVKEGKGKNVTFEIDEKIVDLRIEELQLNRYRIFFEQYGFSISKIKIMAMPRDGGTYIAKSRGINKNIYMISINRLSNQEVLGYYENLQTLVDNALNTGKVSKCTGWESWDGRRCIGYCEVSEACKKMDNDVKDREE